MGFTKAGVHSEHLAVLTLEQSSDEYSSDEDGNVQVGLRQQARFRQQRIVCHRLSVSQIKCRIGKRWLKRSENLQELCQGDVEGFELKAYETNGSRFQRLFEDPQALKIWEHFTDLSEEEQKKILEAADQYNKRSKHNACSITVGQNIPHLQHFIKTVPLDMVKRFEKEILIFFTSKENKTLSFPSSLNNCERRVIHEVCQYYNLSSESVNLEDSRRQVVVNNDDSFFLPHLLLSNCLEFHNAHKTKKQYRGLQ